MLANVEPEATVFKGLAVTRRVRHGAPEGPSLVHELHEATLCGSIR